MGDMRNDRGQDRRLTGGSTSWAIVFVAAVLLAVVAIAYIGAELELKSAMNNLPGVESPADNPPQSN